MNIQLELEKIDNRLKTKRWPILIAGPCSAETEEQVVNTAVELNRLGKVTAFRAGIWKPRTRPGNFEGIGVIGLEWMQSAKQATGMALATEVANAKHVEDCLKHDIDILWIGARTTANPFAVQEIADALKGTDTIVFVKNPTNPDIELWYGALERINRAGIKKLGAIHRGFSPFRKTIFRNDPMWNIALELKTSCPDLPIICDPSHISGNRELIPFVTQKALDLDMNGFMIESHINPACALSDAHQQLTPRELDKVIFDLVLRDVNSQNPEFKNQLDHLRNEIDILDEEIIQKMLARMKIAEKIGEYKKQNGVTVFQISRWKEILNQRISLGKTIGLNELFMHDLLELIHQESIRIQTEIMTREVR